MTDYRFLRTDQDIQRSFIELLQTKDFNNLTITNVISQAMISRPTFYAHFDGLYDLAQKSITTALEPFRVLFKQALAEKVQKKEGFSLSNIYPFLFQQVSDTLIAKHTEYLVIRKLPLGTNSFDQQLKKELIKLLDTYFSYSQTNLQTTMLTSILLGNIDYVLKNQKVPTLEEVQTCLTNILGLITRN